MYNMYRMMYADDEIKQKRLCREASAWVRVSPMVGVSGALQASRGLQASPPHACQPRTSRPQQGRPNGLQNASQHYNRREFAKNVCRRADDERFERLVVGVSWVAEGLFVPPSYEDQQLLAAQSLARHGQSPLFLLAVAPPVRQV